MQLSQLINRDFFVYHFFSSLFFYFFNLHILGFLKNQNKLSKIFIKRSRDHSSVDDVAI